MVDIDLACPIVHCCYHKVGTVWFRRIFREVAREYDLTFEVATNGGANGGSLGGFTAGVDLYLDPHSRTVFGPDVRFLGTHMIRDPRDIVVSGYKYHIWTDEKWVHVPSESWGGLTYQEYLNSLDEEHGMEVEMRRLAGSQFPRMQAWNYSDSRFLEIRYEEMFGNEREVLPKVFAHYSWPEEHLDEAVEIADRLSFHNLAATEEEVGEARSHLRSGETEQWREVYSPRLVDLAHELLTGVLIATGYEASSSW